MADETRPDGSQSHKAPRAVQPWVRAMHQFNTHLSRDFLGGPRLLKLAWVINFHKGTMPLAIALLMWIYSNDTLVAWVYLALHGTYGVCWLLKHVAFPDAQWEARVTFGGVLMSVILVLGPYWLLPYLLISGILGPNHPTPSPVQLATAIGLHTIGIALMLTADAQKYYTLKYRPGLIQEGLFKHVRHPNYLGEMLAYAAYALLIHHWLAWAILGYIWIGYFLVNMRMKEASLARYPEWPAYKASTGFLWPRAFARRGLASNSARAPENKHAAP
ncbi:MAG: DUF1295 domain-containing protein [Litorilinea sp.]